MTRHRHLHPLVKRALPVVAEQEAPCPCYEDEAEASQTAAALAAEAARSAACRQSAFYRFCCMCTCLCMCLCMLCGWSDGCITGVSSGGLPGLLQVQAAAPLPSMPPPVLDHAYTPHEAANSHNAHDASLAPLVTRELLEAAHATPSQAAWAALDDSEPHPMPRHAPAHAHAHGPSTPVDHAAPFNAQHSVAASAGTPVPAVQPHSDVDAAPNLHPRTHKAARASAKDKPDIATGRTHFRIPPKTRDHRRKLAAFVPQGDNDAAAAAASPSFRPLADDDHDDHDHEDGDDHAHDGEDDHAHEDEHAHAECGHAHDHEELSDSDKRMLDNAKYALIPILFVVTLGTSVLPWFMGRLDRALEWISFGACLSAGVIVGVAFSHSLPEAREAWANYFCGREDKVAEYPWAEFLAVAVLLLLVTIDAALVKSGIDISGSHGHGHGPDNGGQHGHSHVIPILPPDYDPTGDKKRKRLELAATAAAAATAGPHGPAHRHPSDPPHVHHHHAHVHVRATPAEEGQVRMDVHTHTGTEADECDLPPPLEPCSVEGAPPAVSPAGVDMMVCPPCDDACPPCDDDCPPATVRIHQDDQEVLALPIMASAVITSGRPEYAMVGALPARPSYGSLDKHESCCPSESGLASPGTLECDKSHGLACADAALHSHDTLEESAEGVMCKADNGIEAMRGTKRAVGQAYVFFVALAIHSMFDGLSIGSGGSVASFYAMLVAVGGHKLLDGFALGVPIFFAKFSRFHTAFSLVFCAAMTPIGIAIGQAATNNIDGEQTQLARAIILSMSCGSFVFISVVELLPAGLMDGKHLYAKMAVTVFGWGLMALLAAFHFH